MTKIAFYLQNKGFQGVDCRNIFEGNPGVAGTEFATIVITTALTERKNLDITMLANITELLPNILSKSKVDNIEDAILYCCDKSIEILVVDYKRLDKELVVKYTGRIKFVVWCHNFVSLWDYHFYSRQSSILRIIHVGREQRDIYRDHISFSKSDFIYCPVILYKSDTGGLNPDISRGKNVVYIGSLNKSKGFHHIAKIWKKILIKHPDANLYVIGSGNFYDRACILGRYNIAEPEYEKKFIKDLIDTDGKILPSVHFLGNMGKEKYRIVEKCKVGIPNPSGESETFGYTAVEKQFMGCIVTTIQCPGYLDTVSDKSYLYKSVHMLYKYLDRALNDEVPNLNNLRDFIYSNFNLDKIVRDWETLFTVSIPFNKKLQPEFPISNPTFRFKWLKVFLYRVKQKYGFLRNTIGIEFIIPDRFYRVCMSLCKRIFK